MTFDGVPGTYGNTSVELSPLPQSHSSGTTFCVSTHKLYVR